MVTATSKGKSSALMQTAQAYAFGEESSKKIKVNILFDSGSQRSYVTEELKRKLNLRSEGRETLNLNTFGSDKYSRKNCDKVKVNLEVGEEVISTSALSFPQLCSPLVSRIDVGKYPHLQGLKLADNSACNVKSINIVLGLDHYYDIVEG